MKVETEHMQREMVNVEMEKDVPRRDGQRLGDVDRTTLITDGVDRDGERCINLDIGFGDGWSKMDRLEMGIRNGAIIQLVRDAFSKDGDGWSKMESLETATREMESARACRMGARWLFQGRRETVPDRPGGDTNLSPRDVLWVVVCVARIVLLSGFG